MTLDTSLHRKKAGGPSGPPSLSTELRKRCAKGILKGLVYKVVLIAALVAQPTAIVNAADEAEPPKKHPRENTLMKRQWGVEILFVRTTSAGYMLEFRYKVVDPDKAKPLFERQTKPMLTHESSGATFVVPTPAKTGALRNSNPPLKDHTYWMFFANPGKYVKQGDIVRIEIGDFVADGIVVE